MTTQTEAEWLRGKLREVARGWREHAAQRRGVDQADQAKQWEDAAGQIERVANMPQPPAPPPQILND